MLSLSTFGSTLGSKIGGFASKIFGTSNDRLIRGYRPRVEAINALEPEIAALSDAELKERTETFRQQLREGTDLEQSIRHTLPPGFAYAKRVSPLIEKLFPLTQFDPLFDVIDQGNHQSEVIP